MFAICRTVKSAEYSGSRQITISLIFDILSRRLHILKCIKIKYSEFMALFSAFFSFNSTRCPHSAFSRSVLAEGEGSSWPQERQGRRGRCPGKSVIPTGLPHHTSHSSARVAFPLAFLGSFPLKESSSVELLSALCCGFLALTSQALSILHSGYFKRGSFVTKTGSCSCRRNKCF